MRTSFLKNKTTLHRLALAAFIITASTLILGGVGGVPYHPDESTQIYMSSDVRAFFRQPSSLFWQPERTGDLRQHYRVMDAPLTRDLIGLTRVLAGLPDQPADWNWSSTWQQNRADGALPDPTSLWVSRMAAAWMLPFSLLLVYLIGTTLGGAGAGWTAMLLFAGNALILLHLRRAMAESALVFTSLLSIWAMLRLKKRAWLLAVPLALAMNAKQTAAILLLPGLATLAWQSGRNWKNLLRDGCLFFLLFAVISLALNPFLWQHPLAAATSAWQERMNFTTDMTAVITGTGAQLPGSFPERLAAEIFQSFFAEPSIAETSNYHAATLAAEHAYFANPLHHLLRGTAGGGAMLALTLVGMLLGSLKILRRDGRERRSIVLLLAVTIVQTLALAWMITIPWQRYYIVVAPLACLWSGYALSDFMQKITGLIQGKKEDPENEY